MKYLFLALSCFLFQTASCQILQLIAADGDLFRLNDVGAENEGVLVDTNGKVIKEIYSTTTDGESLNYITLVDTKAFSPATAIRVTEIILYTLQIK